MKKFLFLVLCALASLRITAVAEDTLSARHPEYLPTLEVGSMAPSFTARDTTGKDVSLTNSRGRYVVLDFWATWCGDCRREVPMLKQLYAERKDQLINGHLVDWLGFSFDDKEQQWKDYLRKEQMPWTQVSNLKRTREDETFKHYQLNWIPAFFLVDPEGRIAGKAITAEGLRKVMDEETEKHATTEFMQRMSALKAVKDIKRIPTNKYGEKYVLKFEHPVDYAHPELGTFTQRVIVCHAGFDRPTVMVTEGYGADYAMSEGYFEEISKLTNSNLVFCEYRYFLESTPEPCNWDHLTVWNSLNDLHEVNQALRQLYPRKWLATGISKGGQTCMFYRAYFPDDVDVSVPYVAPLNKSIEDGRHEPFLTKTVATKVQREAVRAFQIEVLKRRQSMEKLLADFCSEKGYTFNAGVTMAEVLDMCVLEYAYAFWQWGNNTHQIPNLTQTDDVLFKHLVETSGPEYFKPDPYFLSFFVQAARELGYYGYDDKNLQPYLSIKSSKGYLQRLQLPAELKGIRFDPSLYKHTVKYLKENDPRMIFIYGENDPWSASGVCTWLDFSKKKNMHLYVDPNGSHGARITVLPATQREECLSLIRQWLSD